METREGRESIVPYILDFGTDDRITLSKHDNHYTTETNVKKKRDRIALSKRRPGPPQGPLSPGLMAQ
jgi:hypothetical protein